MTVVRVEDLGVVPLPPGSGAYAADRVGPLRDDLRPLEIIQPDGPSFEVNGWEVRWQRWRFRVGDEVHHRFWGQLVRWAAADKPLVAGNEFVRFGTREPLYRQGSEVEVVVRLSDELGGPGRPPPGR